MKPYEYAILGNVLDLLIDGDVELAKDKLNKLIGDVWVEE